MMTSGNELVRRARAYADRQGLTLGKQLGSGIHGIVLVAESHQSPARTAVKIHKPPTRGSETSIFASDIIR
jgi:hypothetical protein